MIFFDVQDAHRVEDGDDGNTDVGKDGCPHIRDAERTENEDKPFDAEGKNDVLIHDGKRSFGDTDRGGDLLGIVIHENDIGGFDRRIRSDGTHRNADIRAGKHGSIVDAVADEGKRLMLGFCFEKCFRMCDLIGGKKLRVYLVDPECARDCTSDEAAVARKHDGPMNADGFQRSDRSLCVCLDRVGNDDRSEIYVVYSDIDDRAEISGGDIRNAFALHQPFAADENLFALFRDGKDTPAGDLRQFHERFCFGYILCVFTDRARDGVRGIAFRERGVSNNGVFVYAVCRMDGGDGEIALRERSGLIENDGLTARERFDIIAALDEDAAFGCAADTAEKAERDGDHKCAWARDDEKRQCAIEPFTPISVKKRGDDGKHEGRTDDDGGIPSCEFGDKIFCFRLFCACVFDELQNLGDGGFFKNFRNAHADMTRKIDRAADDGVACAERSRHGFTCERGGVDAGRTFFDDAVERDLFARFDDDDIADRDLIGRDLDDSAVFFEICVIGADIHECGDGFSRSADGVLLEQNADLIKEHHGDGFGIFSDDERADRGERHQKILVEHLQVQTAAKSFQERIVADDEIGHEIEAEPRDALNGNERERREHGGGDQDARDFDLLLFCHNESPRSKNDLAIGIDFFDGFDGFFEDLLHFFFGSRDRELLKHKADVNAFHAVDLGYGILHFFSANGAIEIFELEGLFHSWIPFDIIKMIRSFFDVVHTHIEYGMDVVVIQRIKNGLAVAARLDELIGLQYAELVRNGGLRESEKAGDVANAKIIFVQSVKNADARGISEDLEKFSEIVKTLFVGHFLKNGFDGVLVYAEIFAFFDRLFFFHSIYPPF